MSIVECVPNFSEGRRQDVIKAIANAIGDTHGCSLLDVDPGQSTNRTVYTFVGNCTAVVNGALNAAKVAHTMIDMTTHKGAHPRMGALDVCPFIPVSGVSMADCVECSKQFGQRLAEALGVPVYLYENSSMVEYRKTLPQIREGEYEQLHDKVLKPEWVPDYGPAVFVPKWGATVTGARQFLIAYNVNLLSTKELAHRIALNIREQGRGPDKPGRLPSVKGIGWYVDDKDMAQVSMNLTDYTVTPLHVAYEECLADARELKLPVVGSEIVGLVPLQAILMAADYYINKESLFILGEGQKVTLAIDRLGLNSLYHFDPNKKIIEYCIGSNNGGALASMSVKKFVESLGARTPSPGGGSASACIAGIGTSLATMVGLLSYGKRQFESLDGIMRETIPPLYDVTQRFLNGIDADADAFTQYMDALKLPRSTDDEITKRASAVGTALRGAIDVPLSMMREISSIWGHVTSLAHHGNIQTMSDLQVGVKILETAIYGGYCNVMINLKESSNVSFTDAIGKEADAILKESREKSSEILSIIQKRLDGNNN